MRSIIINPNGQVTAAVLQDSNLDEAIGCDTSDGRRVCRIPGGGFLYVHFDDNFIAKRLPVNKQVRGLYGGGDLCGTVVLRACDEVGKTIDVPSTMTADSWRSEIDRLRASASPAVRVPSRATSADDVHDQGEAVKILGRTLADLEAQLIAEEGKMYDTVEGRVGLDGVAVIAVGDWGVIRNTTRPVATSYTVARYHFKVGCMEWPTLQLAWRYRNTAPDDDPAVHQQVWQAWLAKRG